MFDLALKIFLLVTPILYLPMNGYTGRFQWFQFGYFSGSINLLQFQFFQYGVVMLFLAALFDKPRRIVQDKSIGVLFLIYVLSIYFHPKTILIFGNIFLGFVLYHLVVHYTKNVKSVVKIIIVVACLNTLFAVLQHFGVHWIYREMPDIIGLMMYKSHLGIYQVMAIPLCFAINPWLALIPMVGLILSKSATAILAVIFGTIIFFRKGIWRIQSPPLWMSCITLIGIFILKSFAKMPVRFNVWFPTMDTIREKWLYGYGFGTFKYQTLLIGTDKSIEYSDPYSLYLGVAHAAGIFALIALGAFIIHKLWDFKNNSYVAQGIFLSCVILTLVGCGYSFLDYPRLAGTAIVLFGLLTIVKQEGTCL